MYSKEEASQLRQKFWISFGLYMKPVPSTDGLPINWINYKTGVKNIFFKMNADHNGAIISIKLTHADTAIRHLIFNQLEEFKTMFANMLQEHWQWEEDFIDDSGKMISQVSIYLSDRNIFNQQHWPDLISFFKSRIILLDEFWSDVKPVFEDLV